MTDEIAPPAGPPKVFRRPVTFCIVPTDLDKVYRPLVEYYADNPDVEIVVERRERAGDRREADRRATPREDADRREQQRRAAALVTTAADLDFPLPRAARRHADRIVCVRRGVPLYAAEAVAELDAVFAAALSGGAVEKEELRLRVFDVVHERVLAAGVAKRRALAVTEDVLEELSGARVGGTFEGAVAEAIPRVLAR